MLLPFFAAGGGMRDRGLERVAALVPDTASPDDRNHLVLVRLAAIKSHMYRHSFCPTRHMIRIMTGYYGVAPEEEKQAIVRDGFPCIVRGVSSTEEIDAVTPIKRVTDTQWSDRHCQTKAA